MVTSVGSVNRGGRVAGRMAWGATGAGSSGIGAVGGPRPGVRRGADRYAVSGQGGAGTVLAVGVCALAIGLVTMVLLLGQAVTAASRAATAADLAALAAADAARGLSPGDPCTVARTVAAANRGALAACRITAERGGTAEVTVTSPMPVPWPAARARARAGAPP